jgi:hypothetical protein
MAWTCIDKFAGSSGDALGGHTPNTGAAWDDTNKYAGSDVKLTGNGFTYNARAGSSLYLRALPATSFRLYATLKFVTNIGGAGPNTCIGLFLDKTVSTDTRFVYDHTNGRFSFVLRNSLPQQTYNYAFPSAGTLLEVRITVTTAATRRFLIDISANAGQTWTTVTDLTDNSPSGDLAAGLWWDYQCTTTTGVHIGNFRIADSTSQVPSVSVTPDAFSTGTPGTLTLSGTGTAWKTGAPTFTVSGGTGASIGSPTITGVDTATATLTPGSAAGTLTITDPTGGTDTVTVSAGVGLSVSPDLFVAGTSGPVTFTGVGTTWLTTAPEFTTTGVDGVTVWAVEVISDTEAVAMITVGPTTGEVQFVDSTTDASTSGAGTDPMYDVILPLTACMYSPSGASFRSIFIPVMVAAMRRGR